MNIQKCKLIIILIAVIVAGAAILTPKTSASHDNGLDDQLSDVRRRSASWLGKAD